MFALDILLADSISRNPWCYKILRFEGVIGAVKFEKCKFLLKECTKVGFREFGYLRVNKLENVEPDIC